MYNRATELYKKGHQIRAMIAASEGRGYAQGYELSAGELEDLARPTVTGMIGLGRDITDYILFMGRGGNKGKKGGGKARTNGRWVSRAGSARKPKKKTRKKKSR